MVITVNKPVVVHKASDLKNNHMPVGPLCFSGHHRSKLVPQERLDEDKLDLDHVGHSLNWFAWGDGEYQQVRSNLTGRSNETAYLGR